MPNEKPREIRAVDPGCFDTKAFVDWMSKNDELARQSTRVITQSSRARDEFLARITVETDIVLQLPNEELDE